MRWSFNTKLLWVVVALVVTAAGCSAGGDSGASSSSTTFPVWATPTELSAAMVDHGSTTVEWALLEEPCVGEYFFANVDERDVRDLGLKRANDVPAFLDVLQYQPDLEFVMLSAFAACTPPDRLALAAFPTLETEFDELGPGQLTCIGDDLRQHPESLEWAAGLDPTDVAATTWDQLFWSTGECIGPERMGEIFNADLQRAYTIEASTCMAEEASGTDGIGLLLQASAVNDELPPAGVTAQSKLMRTCLDPAPFGAEVAGWLTSDPADHACLGTAILDMMAAGVDFDPDFHQASRDVQLRTYEAIFTCVSSGVFFEALLGIELSEPTHACLEDKLPPASISFDLVEERTIHLGNSMYGCMTDEEILAADRSFDALENPLF